MSENKPGFFPIFLDIRARKMIFIGGGQIAERRIHTLAGFEAAIEVISPELSDGLKKLADEGRITWKEQTWESLVKEQAAGGSITENRIAENSIVFACTNDASVNHEIFLYCREQKILVNNCSNHAECDFYFPGIVQKDNVTVAVNAGGSAHKKAREIREKITEMLEESYGKRSF